MDKLTFRPDFGYYDVTKYPYGGDFKRFKNESGELIKGPVKLGDEIRVKLTDNRIIVCSANAVNFDFNRILDIFKSL